VQVWGKQAYTPVCPKHLHPLYSINHARIHRGNTTTSKMRIALENKGKMVYTFVSRSAGKTGIVGGIFTCIDLKVLLHFQVASALFFEPKFRLTYYNANIMYFQGNFLIFSKQNSQKDSRYNYYSGGARAAQVYGV
jgi:hypothetical protein